MNHAELPTRILFAEDVATDAELAIREIKKGNLHFTYRIVDTEDDFLQELINFKPNLVISDYAMPAFDGMTALKITRSLPDFIPFIILTGSMNEETAVECMKAGANDYVIKEQIKRLPFAVSETLEKMRNRAEKENIESQLRESEEKYRSLIDSATDAIVTLNQNAEIISWNKGAEIMFLQKETDVLGQNVAQIIPDSFGHDLNGFAKKAAASHPSNQIDHATDFETVNKKGGSFTINLSFFGWKSSAGQFFTAIMRDVTLRRRIEKTQQFLYQISRISQSCHSLANYMALIHQELKTVLKADNFYIALYHPENDQYTLPYHVDVNESFTTTELISLKNTLTDYIRKTGEARLITEELEKQLQQKEIIHMMGEPSAIWIGAPLIDSSTSAVIGVIALQDYDNKNTYTQNDLNTLEIIAANLGIFIGRIKNLQNLQLSEQRFKSFLNSTTDIVQLEDEKGKLLFANHSFLKLVNLSENTILGKHLSEFLPPDLVSACETSDKEVKKTGLPYKGEEIWGNRIFETLKFPIELGDDKMGIGAIIHDITENKKMLEDIIKAK